MVVFFTSHLTVIFYKKKQELKDLSQIRIFDPANPESLKEFLIELKDFFRQAIISILKLFD